MATSEDKGNSLSVNPKIRKLLESQGFKTPDGLDRVRVQFSKDGSDFYQIIVESVATNYEIGKPVQQFTIQMVGDELSLKAAGCGDTPYEVPVVPLNKNQIEDVKKSGKILYEVAAGTPDAAKQSEAAKKMSEAIRRSAADICFVR